MASSRVPRESMLRAYSTLTGPNQSRRRHGVCRVRDKVEDAEMNRNVPTEGDEPCRGNQSCEGASIAGLQVGIREMRLITMH